MGGGAWPFLVGGAICLVNSGNERDFLLLTSRRIGLPRSTWYDLQTAPSSTLADVADHDG